VSSGLRPGAPEQWVHRFHARWNRFLVSNRMTRAPRSLASLITCSVPPGPSPASPSHNPITVSFFGARQSASLRSQRLFRCHMS
jgi:hypothetical protein